MPTILVVDDEPVNRELIRAVLSHDSYEILQAEDGSQALDLTRKHHPDLVIVDLYMPAMGGTEFIKLVRSDTAIAQTRVALYTGTEVGATIRDFMTAMRIAHVIPKPGEPEEIIRAVREALDQ